MNSATSPRDRLTAPRSNLAARTDRVTLIGLAGDSLHLEIPHDAGHGLGGDLHVEGGGDFHGDAGTGFHGADTHGGADGHEVSSQRLA